MATLQHPNIMGNIQQGMMFGQQQRQMREQRLDQQNLRNLAPQVIAGDAGAFQQAAAINPEAAGQYQQAGDSQFRRLKGAVGHMEKGIATGDPRVVNSYWRQVRPFVSQLNPGAQLPEAWDDSLGDALQEVKARIAMAEGGGGDAGQVVHSQRVLDDGRILNTYRDGTTEVTGHVADRQMWLRDHPGMDPHLVGKSGQAMPVGQPQSQTPAQGQQILPQGGSQQVLDQIAASANQMIAAGIPEAQVEAWAQQQMGGGQAVDGMQPPQSPQGPAPEPQQAPQAGPRLGYQGGGFTRPSEAQTAAQTRAAQHETDLAYADQLAGANIPQDFRRTTDGDLEVIPGSPTAYQREQDERQARLGRERAQRLGTVVVQDMDRALKIMDDQPSLGGGTLAAGIRVAQSRIPGNPWYAMRNHVESAKDTISLENLQGLKEASGAGLGNVSEKQTTLLSHAYGSINLAADDQTLRDALTRTRNIYLDIIFGHGDGPERKPLSYQDRWEPVDEGWVDDQGRPISTFGDRGRPVDQDQSGPLPGAVEGGFRFRGGDPADPNSWERV